MAYNILVSFQRVHGHSAGIDGYITHNVLAI
jgi:hypothetical protein